METDRAVRRLPDEPLVVEPLEEVGKYGGTARVVYTEARNWQDVVWLFNFLGGI